MQIRKLGFCNSACLSDAFGRQLVHCNTGEIFLIDVAIQITETDM